jgi:L-amino acid N-acyltransferase YncA
MFRPGNNSANNFLHFRLEARPNFSDHGMVNLRQPLVYPTIRPALGSDAEGICRIYNHYVLKSTVTFEADAVAANEMRQRILEVTDSFPWLVAEIEGEVVGYAYANHWKNRFAFRNSAETTIYLEKDHVRRGIGTRLYRRLMEELRILEMHCLIAGLAMPNPASVALHEKLGFRKAGQFDQVGRKFGQWIDVGYWQYAL